MKNSNKNSANARSEKINNSNYAQKIIAKVLLQHSGKTAINKMQERAKKSSQSVEEIAWRSAGNLLKSHSLER